MRTSFSHAHPEQLLRTLIAMMIAVCPVLCLLSACGGQEPVVQTTPVNYMQDWMALTKAGFANLDVQSAITITQRLAESGPDGLNPIMDVLGDPAGDPVAKVLAVICLTSKINPSMQPRLLEFTQENKEVTTRACSTHLLGLLKTPEAEKRLKELFNDKERRVRFEASLMLIMHGESEAMPRIQELWNDPEMSARDKTQLILMIPDTKVSEHLDIFKTVMTDMSLEANARMRAATILGHLGDTSVIDVLNSAAEKDTDNDVRTLAKSAADAIKARAQAPVLTAPPPPPGSAPGQPTRLPAAETPPAPVTQ
ncbi:MAG TPA: HEAT repeat domain-containing protein [Candidatus Hydrogenedentes bacterium]|nr:HEAT repeat domain-containing protein [Candidatus Hydrogenedentota bacterium]